ncbi:MAG: ECF transporter S component [Anaerolineae bacterium]|nr:ECF transporter S component [Anaerolineae bacterium]
MKSYLERVLRFWITLPAPQALSLIIYILVMVLGIGVLLYPLLWPAWVAGQTEANRAASSPLVLTLLVSFCFIVLLLEVQRGSDMARDAASTKFIALLGVLVALNSVLRFVETAIPGPAGFSPIFFLIILGGYVYGGRFGFLLGALTLLVSALITGGVGPWLPFQMFTAGWAGLSAPLFRPLVRGFHVEGHRIEVILLAFVGGVWGLLYGILINLWFWPFTMGTAAQSWEMGLTVAELLQRYAAFYVATSLLWDSARAIGNVVMILAFGAPTLHALQRFHRRFAFTYNPTIQS